MSIKATSLLCVLAVWAAAIPAVVIEPDSWPALIFAALATAAIGVNLWRRLGLARVFAIAGTWAGAALAFGTTSDATWVAVFAFVSTGAIVFGQMRRDSFFQAAGIVGAWLVVGLVVLVPGDADGAWTSIFAFLTVGAVANSLGNSRGAAAVLWWALAGVVMVSAEGWYWLSVVAFLLSAASIASFGDFPRRFEWDLWDRDDDGEVVR